MCSLTPPVCTKYGAPMGRLGVGPDFHDETYPLHIKRISLDEGGYDEGGAYWGLRPPGVSLFAVYTLCEIDKEIETLRFVDAQSKQEITFDFLTKEGDQI